MTETLLQIERAGVILGGRRVLDGVSLLIAAGRRVSVTGGSGVGKTVLARLALGLVRPADGLVTALGIEWATLRDDEGRALRSRIGAAAQGGSLLPDLSVEDNLRLGLNARTADAWARLSPRADRMLYEFELETRAAALVGDLSVGERRRLELARALIRAPSLVILDDPFEGASTDARKLLETTARITDREGTAVLLLTQDAAAADRFCDKGYQLSGGRLRPVQQPGDVEASPAMSAVSASAADDKAC